MRGPRSANGGGAPLRDRDEPMTDLAIFLFIAAIAAVIGVGFGIVILAPRIGRMLDRAETAPSESDDEEPGDRPA